MKKLVIFGTENFSKSTHYLFSGDSEYEVAAFTVNQQFLKDTSFLGLPVVPFETIETTFPPSQFEIFVAVGIGNNNKLRERCVNETLRKGYRLASYVSSKSSIPKDMVIEPNIVIMDFTCIGPGVTIGPNVIIWPSTNIGPFTHVEANCWLLGPYIGESVRIGKNTFVGCNATLAPNIQIGAYNIIGAGAVMLKDTKDNQVTKSSEVKISKAPSSKFSKILD